MIAQSVEDATGGMLADQSSSAPSRALEFDTATENARAVPAPSQYAPSFFTVTSPTDTLAIAPRSAAVPVPTPVAPVPATIVSTSPAPNGNTFIDAVAAPTAPATTTATTTAVAPPPSVSATGSATGSTTDTGSSGGTNTGTDTADNTKTLLQFLASTLGAPQPVQSSLAPVDLAPLDTTSGAVAAAPSGIDSRGLIVMLILFAAIGGGGYYWYKRRRARG